MMGLTDGATSTAERSPRGRTEIVIGVALIILMTFVTLRGVYLPMGPPGIDPGWQWAVNQAGEAGHVFGRDIVFTYGPLAFLMVPMDVSNNLLTANLFFILVQLAFAAVLIELFRRTRRLIPLAACLVLYVAADHQGLALEAFLLIVVGLLALAAIASDRWLPVAAASTLSAVLLFTKLTLGLGAIITLAATLAVSRILLRRSRRFVIGLIPLPVVATALAFTFFDTPSSLVNWLSLSAEIVSGYSSANSIIGASSELVMGVVMVAGWLLAVIIVRSNQPLFAFTIVFTPLVLIQFRLAFVRQDTHQYQFVPFLLALTALSILFANPPRRVWIHMGVYASVVVAGSLTLLVEPIEQGLLPKDLVVGGRGARALSNLIHLDRTRQDLKFKSDQNLEPLQLTEGWLHQLKDAENGVGMLPWEIQYSPANALSWNPTPTLQIYSAYTSRLDNWSAAHYLGNKAPQFIINQFSAVETRRQLFDAPATWRTLFLNYEIQAAAMGFEPLLLLERRNDPPQYEYLEIHRETMMLEETGVEVPHSGDLVFAEIDLDLTQVGRIQKSLFRVPLIFAIMTHQSGHVSRFRLIPETAPNGVLINRFPRDFRGYRRLWQGIPDDPVVRLSLTGPGTAFFKREATIVWRELRLQP